MHLREVMSPDLRICYKDEPLLEATARLATSGGNSFVVVSSPEKPDLVGMLTLRDVANALANDTEPFEALSVSNVMSPAPHVCNIDDKLWEVAEAMQFHGIRHLPVLDRPGHVAGMISLTDLAEVVVSSERGGVDVLTPQSICSVLVATARRLRPAGD